MTPASVSDPVGAVLFTDLVGFTEFNDVAGDEAALEVLDAQTSMATAAVEDRRDARIVKELGDGLMIWFGSAVEGLHAAVTLMQRVDAARRTGEFPLSVRMGMHHGPAIARGDDVVGQTVNIASRVSDQAGPGELLVSESVVDACGDEIPPGLQAVGPCSVKGVHTPVWLHRIEI